MSLKKKRSFGCLCAFCFIFYRNVQRSKTQDDSTKVMTPFSYPRLYCSILNFVNMQRVVVMAMCLSRTADCRWAACLLIRSRGEICFFSHKQMLDIASNATVALNMINVSEHYIQSA